MALALRFADSVLASEPSSASLLAPTAGAGPDAEAGAKAGAFAERVLTTEESVAPWWFGWSIGMPQLPHRPRMPRTKPSHTPPALPPPDIGGFFCGFFFGLGGMVCTQLLFRELRHQPRLVCVCLTKLTQLTGQPSELWRGTPAESEYTGADLPPPLLESQEHLRGEA
jgi:hypothetical protein